MTAPRRAYPTGRAMVCALLILSLGLTFACSNEDSSSTSEASSEQERSQDTNDPDDGSELSLDDASLLAETLYRNWELGGAQFTLNAIERDGSEITLEGEVDWKNHAGAALVEAGGPEAPIIEARWVSDAIYENQPALVQRAQGLGADPFVWLKRPPAPDERDLDSLVAIVTGLAATQRDNPVLLAQAEGSANLGTTEVDGRAAVRLRQGDNLVYTIDSQDGTLYAVEGVRGSDQRPFRVDLSNHGSTQVELPDPTTVTDVQELIPLLGSGT